MISNNNSILLIISLFFSIITCNRLYHSISIFYYYLELQLSRFLTKQEWDKLVCIMLCDNNYVFISALLQSLLLQIT